MFKKYAKRAGRAIKRAVKKRYVTKTGKGLRMKQIVKDVSYLKSVLNPEKKIFQLNQTDVLVGQCNINASAHYVLDVTPKMSQGSTDITRNGNSIKVHSGHFRFQFQAENQASGHPIRIRAMLIKVIGAPIASANLVSEMFKPNPFVSNGTIYDYHSDRREDTFKRFRVLRYKDSYIKENAHNQQFMHANMRFGIKYKSHHVKFSSNASTDISDGQLFMVVFADSGNINGTTSTLTGTAITAGNTGFRLCGEYTQWYYDN